MSVASISSLSSARRNARKRRVGGGSPGRPTILEARTLLTIAFAPAASYPVGTGQIQSLAVGDVNGDDLPDIVSTTGTTSAAVDALLGRGDGSFDLPIASATATVPIRVGLGAFTPGGPLDLVTSTGSSGVQVAVGDGSGRFSGSTQLGPTGDTYGIAVADATGDGKLDVVSSDLSSGVAEIFPGNGDGTFGTEIGLTPAGSTAVAVADLNGDGIPDVVAADYDGPYVRVFYGEGNGQFAAGVGFGTIGVGANSVAVGDFNRDGLPDIATADQIGSDVAVLLNQGNGTFAPAALIHDISAANDLAIADVDGDGNPDIIVAGGQGVTVLPGRGDGMFGSALNFDPGVSSDFVRVADFNGDGRPDLAVATYSGTADVLLNESAGPPTQVVLTATPPTSVVADSPFLLPARILDASGFLDTSYNGPVTIAVASGPPGEGLDGVTTFDAAGGLATFAALTLSEPGSVVLTVSAPGLTSASTAPITVTPIVPTQIVALSPVGTPTVSIGIPFDVTIAVEDAFGAIDTDFNGPIIVTTPWETAADPSAMFTQQVVAGEATFSLTATAPPGPARVYFSNALVSQPALTGTLDVVVAPAEPKGDFFGDGTTDLGVYGYGRYLIAEPGTTKVIDQPFGGPDDVPVTGDFFGDGKADIGVYGYGRFLIIEPGTDKVIDQPLGGPDDVPVVGDFFGDGHDDLAVYGYGRFFALDPATGKTIDQPLGGPDDVPVVGDFFGTGTDDFGVYGYGRFFTYLAGTNVVVSQPIGGPEDVPIVGDFVGDGRDDFGLYGYGRFVAVEPLTETVLRQSIGGPDDVPVVGDYFGDGKDDFAVYGYGRFAAVEPGTARSLVVPFGGPEDTPILEAPTLLYPARTLAVESIGTSPTVAESSGVVPQIAAPSPTNGTVPVGSAAPIRQKGQSETFLKTIESPHLRRIVQGSEAADRKHPGELLRPRHWKN